MRYHESPVLKVLFFLCKLELVPWDTMNLLYTSSFSSYVSLSLFHDIPWISCIEVLFFLCKLVSVPGDTILYTCSFATNLILTERQNSFCGYFRQCAIICSNYPPTTSIFSFLTYDSYMTFFQALFRFVPYVASIISSS